MNSILQFISRCLTKLLLYDGAFFKRKSLLIPAVHGPADRLIVGERTDLNDTIFNTMGGSIRVGDYAFFGHGCQVLTGVHEPNTFNLDRKEHPTTDGDIDIGQGVWIGSGAIILSGVSIADHCVIAAGAVVTKDCTDAGIYAGVPAELIKAIDVTSIPNKGGVNP